MAEPAVENNYLGLTDEEKTAALTPEEKTFCSSAHEILKEFRSLDCTVCGDHFGFQHRWDPKIIVCTPNCLTVATKKVKNLSPSQYAVSKPVSGIPSKSKEPSAVRDDVPRPVLQGLGTQNQVNVTVPRVNYRELNGNDGVERIRRDRDSSYGSERSTTVPNDRGGNNTSSRGGRSGYSNSGQRGGRTSNERGSRGFGRNDRADENPLRGGNGKAEDWGEGAYDEIDSKIEQGQRETPVIQPQPLKERNLDNENISIPTSDSGFKSIEMSKKEAMLNAARQPRVVRPGPGARAAEGAENGSVPIPKVIERKESVEKSPKLPVPVTQVVEKKAVEPATAPSVQKKVEAPPKNWKMKDTIYSLSLTSQVLVGISFPWSASKFTVVAVVDNPKLQGLQEELDSYCKQAPPISRALEVDDIVFAVYDGSYYRGRVDSVSADKKEAAVTFVDFGDKSTVKLEECREADNGIMQNHPIYGVILELELKRECPAGFSLSDELQQATENEEGLKMEIISSPKDSMIWKGKLYLDEERCFNDMLDKQIEDSIPKPATPQPAAPTPAAADPKTPVEAVAKDSPPSSASKPVEVPRPKTSPFTTDGSRPKTSPFATGVKGNPNPTMLTIHTAKWSDKLDHGARVHVNYPWDCYKMAASAVEDDANLEKLQAYIGEYVKNAPAMQRIPAVDEIVIGPYSGAYYRGRVTTVDGDSVTLEFLDYGDSTTVKSSELKELSEEINKHPIYGVVLLMEDVAEDQDFVGSLSDKLLEDGQIEHLGQRTARGWPVRLWFGETCWSDMVAAELGQTPN